MGYTIELLGYNSNTDEYVYIESLRDFGLDFRGAKEYAMDLACNHTQEVINEVKRKSKTLLPFMVTVNSVHNGYARPMFGYEYDGETIEKVQL